MASLGRYTLLRRVGAGGMAEIWKARTQGPAGFSKTVAIKRVLPEFAADEEFIEMFVEEAKLVARLVHPNIVQVFDFNEAKGDGELPEYFITMEYVAGQNLAAVLKRLKGPFPLPVALFVTMEAARGLAHAHEEKDDAGHPLALVHRDVSPHNLLVSWKGEVKVADFGIAKVASVSRTATGIMKGKVAYMSPEQAKMEPLDSRSDVFSLGVVLWELLAGARLFSERSGEEIYRRVVAFKLPDVSAFPPDVRAVLEKCLQPDRERRYPDARALEAELLGMLGASGLPAARAELISLLARLFANEQQQEIGDMRRPEGAPPVVVAPIPDDSRNLAVPPPIQANTGPERSLIRPAGEDGMATWIKSIEEAEADPDLLTNIGGERVRGGTAMSAPPEPSRGDRPVAAAAASASGDEDDARGGTQVSPPRESLTGALRKFGDPWAPDVRGSDGQATAIKPTNADVAATALRPAIPRSQRSAARLGPGNDIASVVTEMMPDLSQPTALMLAGAVALAAIGLGAGLWIGGLVGGGDGAPSTPVSIITASPAAVSPVPGPSPSPPATPTKADRLRSLDNLLRDSLIPRSEYDRRRDEILNE